MVTNKPQVILNLKLNDVHTRQDNNLSQENYYIESNGNIHLPVLKRTEIKTWEKNINFTKDSILIFTSVAAVDNFCKYIKNPCATIIAIGRASGDRLNSYGVKVDYIPQVQSSEGLLDLVVFNNVFNKNIYIIKGIGGRRLLKKVLEKKGAKVKVLNVYRRQNLDVSYALEKIYSLYEIKSIIISSVAVFKSLWASATEDIKDIIRKTNCEVYSLRMLKSLRKYGLNSIKII